MSFRIENDCGSVCTGLNFQGLSYNSNCRFGIKEMNSPPYLVFRTVSVQRRDWYQVWFELTSLLKTKSDAAVKHVPLVISDRSVFRLQLVGPKKKPPLRQWKQWSKMKLREEWNSAPGFWRSAGLLFKLFNLIYKLTSLWITLPASCMTLWQRQRNRESRVLPQETGAGTQALSSWQSFRLPSHNTVQRCCKPPKHLISLEWRWLNSFWSQSCLFLSVNYL